MYALYTPYREEFLASSMNVQVQNYRGEVYITKIKKRNLAL